MARVLPDEAMGYGLPVLEKVQAMKPPKDADQHRPTPGTTATHELRRGHFNTHPQDRGGGALILLQHAVTNSHLLQRELLLPCVDQQAPLPGPAEMTWVKLRV